MNKTLRIAWIPIVLVMLMSSMFFVYADDTHSYDTEWGSLLVETWEGSSEIYVDLKCNDDRLVDNCILTLNGAAYNFDTMGESSTTEGGKTVTEYGYTYRELPELTKGDECTVTFFSGASTVKKSFMIRREMEGNITVSPKSRTYVYIGSKIDPSFTFKEGTYKLVKGQDYVMKYEMLKGYNKKANPDAVQNIGDYYCYAEGTGEYDGSAVAYATVLPKGTSVAKVTSPKKRTVKVKWKKQSEKMPNDRIAGYQIRYGTNKSFKKGTYNTVTVNGYKNTVKTIKKLKSKKAYYFQVRTFAKIKHEDFGRPGTYKYYSRWSGTKKVKVK